MKPKISLDTNVCSSIASGKIPPADWQLVRNHIRRNYNYRISALTLIDLLRRIAFGDEAHFEQNREGLRVVYGPYSNMKFLRFPGIFLLRTLFNDLQTKPQFEPSDLEKWIKVTLRAANKEALISGTVTLPGNSNMSFGMALEKVTDPLQEGINEHVQRLTDLRNGLLEPSPSGERWALGILKLLQADTSESACKKVAESLDGAYRYDDALWNLAKNNTYDFSKHASDWVDFQQLFYLCDATLSFLTMDGDFEYRTYGSSQESRILKFSQFLDLAHARD